MDGLKFALGGFFIVSGICGMGIGLLGDTVVSSTIAFINGLELSSGMLLFSIMLLLSGVYLMSTSSN
mgnify:CR=1 FL=1